MPPNWMMVLDVVDLVTKLFCRQGSKIVVVDLLLEPLSPWVSLYGR